MDQLEVRRLAARYETLRSERTGWDSAWRTLAGLFLPARWRSDTDTTAHKSPGNNDGLINSTGVLAMRTLAAGMQGGMTSPVRPWFRLVPQDEELGKRIPGLAAWLDEVTQAMQTVLHQSNFYTAVHGLYADLGCFGTALMLETADADGLNFELVRAGEYVLDINGRGEVDTFFRRIYMTARQIVDRWGDGENVPESVKAAVRAGRSETGGIQRFEVVHGVFPRERCTKGYKEGPDAKEYRSVYFMAGGSGPAQGGSPAVLDEGGYDMFPAFAPRWDINGTDVYGRSPAMDVAPDCRMLQGMTKTLREMQHKIAAPPLVVDSSLRQYGVRLMPGGLTFADMQRSGIMPVTPIHQPEAQALNYTMQGIKDVEQMIYTGLYTDLFRLLIDNDRRQITATEISAKQQEKMILIGPVVERLHKELLEPVIKRTFGLMREWGALPVPPAELLDSDMNPALDVTFESVLAQAQKLAGTSAIDQVFSFAANAAAVKPDMLDKIDFDALLDVYAGQCGIPARIMRSDDDVAALREQRAQAEQQAAAQAQAAQQSAQLVNATAAAKNLGQTPVGADGQTLIGTILGGLGAV